MASQDDWLQISNSVRRNFVVVPKRDFDRMQRENEKYRQLIREDDKLWRTR